MRECHLVVKGVVVVRPAVKRGRSRDADHVILGRVAGGKPRMVDGAEFGILHDGCCLLAWLRRAQARRDRRRLDAFSLVEIEDVRPPDERSASAGLPSSRITTFPASSRFSRIL